MAFLKKKLFGGKNEGQNDDLTQYDESKESEYDEQNDHYALNMWDDHGIKTIQQRVKKSMKSMKQLLDFFQEIANMQFKNSTIFEKYPNNTISENEAGTTKFILDKYASVQETESQNTKILGSKISANCYQKLNDEINRISKLNTTLTTELLKWNNTHSQYLNKVQQGKRLSADKYNNIVIEYREFRLKYDSGTKQLLLRLEQVEIDRINIIHQCLKTHLQFEQQRAQQRLKNLEAISKQIENIDAISDIKLFVESSKSNDIDTKKPSIPKFLIDPNAADDEKASANVGEIKQSEIYKWLNNAGFDQYYNNFAQNGFDNLDFIKQIQNVDTLKDIGIELKGHQLKLLSEIEKLTSTNDNEQ